MGRRTRKEAAAAGAGPDQVDKVADAIQSVPIRAVAAFLLVFAPVLCAIMWEDMFQYVRSWFSGMDQTGAADATTTTAAPFTIPFSSTFETLSSGNDNGVLVAKVTAMAVLGLASITLGLLPLRLASWLRWGQHSHRKPGGAAAALHSHDSPAAGGIFLSLLLCFGGGVLMCTTFVHMLPEVQESFMELEEAGELEGPLEKLAHTAPHLLMCAGFFIMYIVEELVHVYLHWRSHGKKETERTVASPKVTEASQEFGEVKMAPLMSLKWDVQEKKSSTVVLAYADGTEVKSEVPPQFRVSAVTFANPWGAASEGEKQFLKVDAERPCCKGKARVAKVSSKCHKVHHDHLEPDVTGNMPNFMSGANHHSHAIPASAAAPASHGHHDHHHDDDEEEDSVVSALRGLLIVMALSVHELFEGLAVGLEGSAANVWYMLAAVACHKLVIAFCIGVELVAMRTKLPFHFLYVATFALVSPLGIGVGILVTASYGETETGLVPAILQGLATGTLLYVVFFEILERQRACGHSGLRQYLAVLAGFLLMFGLSFIGGHSHSHGHGHGHSHAHAHVHAHDVMEHAHFDSNHSDGHAH